MARTVEGAYEPSIINFDAGRRFQSLVCKVTTDVPTEYFQHLGHTGQRVDKYECPELVLGTYEFLCKKCLGTDSSQGKPQLISNINASQSIVDAIRTTLGPRSMDKHIVDTSGKATISNDGASSMKLLHIVHPAVKL
ncbi:protein transport protein Sec24C-like [Eurosta solidaginis]|uniref:protein transport protein Sec24C-like n=1 Tax=Eurosta solidaginis TaxID=178769 RepID=UPI0035314D14